MADIEKLQAALEADPTDTQAFVNLCDYAEKEGDFGYLAELLKYRAQVTRDEQEVVDLYFRAGEVYIDKLEDIAGGAEVLLMGFEHDPTHAGIGDRLDNIYREVEDWEAALHVAETRLDALAKADVHGTKVVIRSDLHQQAGEILDRALQQTERALAHYRKAIELDKSNLLAIYGAREIYYAAGKFKNAAKLCELEARVEKDTDRRIALYRELAHILSTNLDDQNQAVVALKRALKLNQEDPEVKLDLARTIAAAPLTEESAKDHRWASEFLLREAREAAPGEGLPLARLALMALPDSAKAVEFIEGKAREEGALEELVAAYQQIIDALGDLEAKAPMIRRLGKLYVEEIGSPEEGLACMQQLEPLGYEEDKRFIERLSKGVEVRASQMPPPAAATSQPEYAAEFDSSAEEEPAAEEPPAADDEAGLFDEPDEQFPEEEEPEPEAAAEPEPEPAAEPSVSQVSAEAELAPPAAPPEGMSTEEFVAELQQAAERARRTGDDATAEERMLQVLDYDPHDQKATTYLERRFRARGDWGSLRDLLLKSSGAEHLPPAVRTVRLREAARLSEEQLGDLEGAIQAWKTIRTNDPKVRDAADALKRLLASTERWGELLEVLQKEAETTKSRAKRIEAYRRLAEIYHIRLSDARAAAENYKNVLDLSPEDIDAIEALDELYLREQQYDELVPLLEKRAEMSRDREEKRGHLMRAAITLRERLDRPEEAYAMAQEILNLVPRNDEALELMESIDEEGEHWERLLDVLEQRSRAAEDPAAKADFQRKKALSAAHRLGDFKSAILAWRAVLDLQPGDIEALDALAEIHEEKGEWEELVQVLEQRLETIEDVHDRAEVHRRIAHVLDDELEQPDRAMESWRKVLEAGEDVESLGALSRYYERIEDWSELVEVLARQAPYAEDHLERADILFRRASILYEKQGEREEAVNGLRQVLQEVDPTHIATLETLRQILVEDNLFEEAAEVIEQQIAHTTDQTALKELLVTLGNWARAELDDLERAVDSFERAAQIDPNDGELLDTLDDVYVAAGEWDKLLKLIYGRYQRQEDEEIKLEILRRGGGLCEEKLEDAAKAWSWYRQAFDALRHLDETIPAVEEAAHRLELWKELIDVYGIMVRTETEVSLQVEWWLKIADVFEEKLEDPAKGLEAVLRAFGLEPENAELLDRVDRLAVASQNWQRLGTVYNALAGRAEDKAAKIELLRRYSGVLNEQGNQASPAFDVALKAFELDPSDEELLELVERIGEQAQRWDDLVRVYTVCAKLSEELPRKVDLRMRAAAVQRDKIDDSDGALATALDVLRLDPFSDEVVNSVWNLVRELEEALLTTEKGVYWGKLIEIYRQLVADNRHERENQVDLLMVIARIYAEELRDESAAFECLKEAQQINPRDEATIAKLEEMAREQGFWESVVDHYADILDETFEMDVAVMYHRRRARILEEELDQADEAAEHYWQIIQLDSKDATAYRALLIHYEKTEKWNELVNLLERQLDATEPGETEKKRKTQLQIAGVWEKKIHNKYEAKDWYEAVLLNDPEDEDAKAGLARLEGDDGGDDEEDDDIKSLLSIPPPAPGEEEEAEAQPELAPGLDRDDDADDLSGDDDAEEEEQAAGDEFGDEAEDEEEPDEDSEAADDESVVEETLSDDFDDAAAEGEEENGVAFADDDQEDDEEFDAEETVEPVDEDEVLEEADSAGDGEPSDLPDADAEHISFMPSAEETLTESDEEYDADDLVLDEEPLEKTSEENVDDLLEELDDDALLESLDEEEED